MIDWSLGVVSPEGNGGELLRKDLRTLMMSDSAIFTGGEAGVKR